MSTRDDDSAAIHRAGSPEPVTPEVLKGWPLPAPGGSKYGRGQIVVVGGSASAPGAAMLAGLAALRVGAGRLTLAVSASIAPFVAVAIPECGVTPLPESGDELASAVFGGAADELDQADAVPLGPGLHNPDFTSALLEALPEAVGRESIIVLDAFALGVLPRLPSVVDRLRGRLILSPNSTEAEFLLGALSDDPAQDVGRIADRYDAVVSYSGLIATPRAIVWKVGAGNPGLGTSGSGDVLAGSIAGLCARGVELDQAAVWGTYCHAAAGDLLAKSVAPLGYLASELLPQLPAVVAGLAPV